MYRYEAWVHPEMGGDDFPIVGKITAPNLKDAEKQIKLLLKLRGSAVTNDFTVKETKS
jgi:hypothetical protein